MCGGGGELFLLKDFWRKLKRSYSEISEVEISGKVGDLENELTKYRYDVLIHLKK